MKLPLESDEVMEEKWGIPDISIVTTAKSRVQVEDQFRRCCVWADAEKMIYFSKSTKYGHELYMIINSKVLYISFPYGYLKEY